MIVQNIAISKNNIERMDKMLPDEHQQSGAGSGAEKTLKYSDDAAVELYISDRFGHQRNVRAAIFAEAQDEICLLQMAEKGLRDTDDALTKIEELARKAAFDSPKENERDIIREEVNKLIEEIDHISESTKFNGMSPLDSRVKYISMNDDPERKRIDEMRKMLGTSFCDASAENLGLGELDLSTEKNSGRAADAVREARNRISGFQDDFDKEKDRLEKLLKELHDMKSAEQDGKMSAGQNIQGKVIDVSRNSIIKQKEQSVIAQANSAPNGAMQLLS